MMATFSLIPHRSLIFHGGTFLQISTSSLWGSSPFLRNCGYKSFSRRFRRPPRLLHFFFKLSRFFSWWFAALLISLTVYAASSPVFPPPCFQWASLALLGLICRPMPLFFFFLIMTLIFWSIFLKEKYILRHYKGIFKNYVIGTGENVLEPTTTTPHSIQPPCTIRLLP